MPLTTFPLSYYNEKGLIRTAEMENYDANIRYSTATIIPPLILKPTRNDYFIGLASMVSLLCGNYPQQSTSDLFASAMED